MLDLKLIAIAEARYPGELPVSLLYVESDRRAAGLGALAKTQGRGEVRNYKLRDAMQPDRVTYHVVVERDERLEYPPVDPFAWPSAGSMPECATITLIRRPAVNVHLAARVEFRDLFERRGYVARVLRDLRRQRLAEIAKQAA